MRKRRREYTEDEKESIKMWFKRGMSWEDMGRKLGRKANSVRGHAIVMDLPINDEVEEKIPAREWHCIECGLKFKHYLECSRCWPQDDVEYERSLTGSSAAFL